MAVFWDVAQCNLVGGGASIIRVMSHRTTEMSVNIYQTTRRNNLEDSHLHTHRYENLILKSCNMINT
jgi:hypothetical protein